MSGSLGRVFRHLEGQRGLIAVWQMHRLRCTREQIEAVLADLTRVHRGVYAAGDLDELGGGTSPRCSRWGRVRRSAG